MLREERMTEQAMMMATELQVQDGDDVSLYCM
jgi:hypothetical protein